MVAVIFSCCFEELKMLKRIVLLVICHHSLAWKTPRHKTPTTVMLHESISMSFGDDPVIRLPLMEAELAVLNPNDDNEELRRTLQSSIGDARTAAEFGVRRAQLQFYEAFASHDIEAMGQVWSNESHTRCIHPGMSAIEGIGSILQSWEHIFRAGEEFQIEPDRARIEICGQTAICSCVEKINGRGTMEAMNVYKRENGSWRMTLHMAAPVAMIID